MATDTSMFSVSVKLLFQDGVLYGFYFPQLVFHLIVLVLNLLIALTLL